VWGGKAVGGVKRKVVGGVDYGRHTLDACIKIVK
jgi:hypothetical protein